MTVSAAVQSLGTLWKIGDSGGGAAVKATRAFSSGTTGIVFTAVTAGTAGNSITVVLVASGANTPLSIAVVGNAITVNLRTDGGSAAAGSVNDVVAAIYASAAARALVDAAAATTGLGILGAASVQNLASGAPGGEVFTTLGGLVNLTGPQFKADILDVTHLDSTNIKEKIATLVDGGQLSGEVQFVPSSTQHRAILADLVARTKRNSQIWFADQGGSVIQIAGYFTQWQVSSTPQGIYTAAMQYEITGSYSWIV